MRSKVRSRCRPRCRRRGSNGDIVVEDIPPFLTQDRKACRTHSEVGTLRQKGRLSHDISFFLTTKETASSRWTCDIDHPLAEPLRRQTASLQYHGPPVCSNTGPCAHSRSCSLSSQGRLPPSQLDSATKSEKRKEVNAPCSAARMTIQHGSSLSSQHFVVYGAFLVADMFQAVATTNLECAPPWVLCVMVLAVAVVTAPAVRPVAHLLLQHSQSFGATSALVYCCLRVLVNTVDVSIESIFNVLCVRLVAATASNLLFFTILSGEATTILELCLGDQQTGKSVTEEKDRRLNAFGDPFPRLSKFTAFRWNYLLVCAAIMLADGLQGTHLYVLYEGYGFSVASLYSLGFLSGAITSPVIGPLVDRMGRKKAAMLYCALEVLINLLEQFPLLTGLIISRVISGITTNLLYSVFESWLVSEHRRRGFAEEKIEVLLRDSVIVSNLSAILSGYVAHALASWLGPVGPFEGAVTSTAVALVLVATLWRENYGVTSPVQAECKSAFRYLSGAFQTIVSDFKILRLGLIQGLTEGSLQTFVFLWSPALRRFSDSAPPTTLGLDIDGQPAYGLIFGAFMACGVAGGLFQPTARRAMSMCCLDPSTPGDDGRHGVKPAPVELLTSLCYILSAGLLCVPVVVSAESPCAFPLTLGAFLLYEVVVGLYMPCEGLLRSIYMPNDSMCSLMTMLRVIVNVAVGAAVISTHYIPIQSSFATVGTLMAIAGLIQFSFLKKSDLMRRDKDCEKWGRWWLFSPI